MSDDPLILAIDQGTTSSRAIVFDGKGSPRAVAQQEFKQHFPQPGWVEHDPEDIWDTTIETARAAMTEAEESGGRVIGIGITNQRETTLVWDRSTGQAVHNAIVWQDRRTAEICRDLKGRTSEADVTARSGLLLDPYFSSTKAAWILDHVDGAREKAAAGSLAFGTVDSFLLWRLTGGEVHATDVTNASRTNLYNIHDLAWDDTLLELFNVPKACLPEVRDCAGEFGHTDPDLFGRPLPVLGIAGDQQAAAIGQACFAPGTIKSTYGTGCFVILNTGTTAVPSKNRLLTTIGYRIGDDIAYAIEGSIFVAGAAIQWLRDELGIIESSAASEELAASLPGNDGVYLVPAFTGLGAPYWDPDARGALSGLSRNSGAAHFARAAIESVGYQTADLFAAMAEDGAAPTELRIDGGMVANNWFAQFLADILGIPVDRPVVTETTALGAFYLAGLESGLFTTLDDVAKGWQRERRFEPAMAGDTRTGLLAGWHKAVSRVRDSGD